MTNQHAPATAHDNPGEPHDPTRSADGQTARRLTNTSGQYSLERARDSFDHAQTGGSDSASARRGGIRGSNGALMLLYGLGLGAALMYLLDPEHGERRRERLSERLAGLSNRTADLAGKTTRELRGRAQDVVSQASGLLRRQGSDSGQAQTQGETGSAETGAAASAGAAGAGGSNV
ncbi:MAG TPA: hypothetical protein VGV59_07175 [Pyrinomonadaceae bacterium]|nr:hypothetical protein [Pyrinomonadaceae bacterium]